MSMIALQPHCYFSKPHKKEVKISLVPHISPVLPWCYHFFRSPGALPLTWRRQPSALLASPLYLPFPLDASSCCTKPSIFIHPKENTVNIACRKLCMRGAVQEMCWVGMGFSAKHIVWAHTICMCRKAIFWGQSVLFTHCGASCLDSGNGAVG